ncbi:MAG: hypothetical protein WBQ23_04475 [Bacteroidota bacterium]
MAEIDLPDLVLRSSYSSEHEFLSACYAYFVADFLTEKPTFDGLPCRLKRFPYRDGREATFYHFTTEGPIEEERQTDEDRLERIRWPRPVIERCREWGIKIWPQNRGGRMRLCIWVEEFDYCVILDLREKYFIPWATFMTRYPHERRAKRKEYQAYVDSQKNQR